MRAGGRRAPWSRAPFIPFYSLETVSWRVISIFSHHILEGTFHPFVDGSLSHLSNGRTSRGYFHCIHCKGTLGALSFPVHVKGTGDVYIHYVFYAGGKSSSEVFYLLTAYMEAFFWVQSIEANTRRIPNFWFGLFFVCFDKAVNQHVSSLKSTQRCCFLV